MFKPTLQALILADHVHRDSATGKMTIIGTFNNLNLREIPGAYRNPTYAYVSLRDVFGETTFSLKFVDLTNEKVLLETANLELNVKERMKIIELVIQVPPIPVPHEGVYSFELYVGEELLGSLRVQATLRKGKP